MSPSRLPSDSSSIISLSSFETTSSLNVDPHYIPLNENLNNHQNALSQTKSFDRMLNQAVEYFEQILGQCTNQSNATSIQNEIQSPRSLEKGRTLKKRRKRRRERKICRRMFRNQDEVTSDSQNPDRFGSTFYCRRALLQNPDGTTFICIRKRSN